MDTKMTRTHLLLLAAAAITVCSHAHAENKAQVQNTVLSSGPAIKGVCILNRSDVLSASKVAQSANLGYRQAVETAQKEIDVERNALQSDVKQSDEKRAKMKPDELEKTQKELQARLAALQSKANDKTQSIEATRQNVLQRISREAQPIIEEVYKGHGCGLLLAREAVLAGNAGMDITAEVIGALDKRITELAFVNQDSVAVSSAK